MDIGGLVGAGLAGIVGYAPHGGGIGTIKEPFAPICGFRRITDKKKYFC